MTCGNNIDSIDLIPWNECEYRIKLSFSLSCFSVSAEMEYQQDNLIPEIAYNSGYFDAVYTS